MLQRMYKFMENCAMVSNMCAILKNLNYHNLYLSLPMVRKCKHNILLHSTNSHSFLLRSLVPRGYLCLTPSFLSSSCHFGNWEMFLFPLLWIIFIFPYCFCTCPLSLHSQLAHVESLFTEQRCTDLK